MPSTNFTNKTLDNLCLLCYNVNRKNKGGYLMNYRGVCFYYPNAIDLSDFKKVMTFHSKFEGDLEVYILDDWFVVSAPNYMCRFVYWSELLRYCEDMVKGV